MKCSHNLVELMRKSAGLGIFAVARWCTNCGAVVIDGEHDDRTRPGHYMPMRRPVATRLESLARTQENGHG